MLKLYPHLLFTAQQAFRDMPRSHLTDTARPTRSCTTVHTCRKWPDWSADALRAAHWLRWFHSYTNAAVTSLVMEAVADPLKSSNWIRAHTVCIYFDELNEIVHVAFFNRRKAHKVHMPSSVSMCHQLYLRKRFLEKIHAAVSRSLMISENEGSQETGVVTVDTHTPLFWFSSLSTPNLAQNDFNEYDCVYPEHRWVVGTLPNV